MTGFGAETGFDAEITVTDDKGRACRYTRARMLDASADRDIVITRNGELEFKSEALQGENSPKTIVIAFEKDDGWQSFEYVLSD